MSEEEHREGFNVIVSCFVYVKVFILCSAFSNFSVLTLSFIHDSNFFFFFWSISLLLGPNLIEVEMPFSPSPSRRIHHEQDANEMWLEKGAQVYYPSSDWQLSDTHDAGTHAHICGELSLIKDFHAVELGNDFEMLTTVKLRSPKPFHRLKFGCRSQNRRR